MNDPRLTILVFARYPAAGQVKTRMCPPLSFDEAAAVQRGCIGAMAEWLRGRDDAAVRWVLTPDDAVRGFRELVGHEAMIWAQGEGDLGKRMELATRRAFDEGARGVILLGTDSPMMADETLDLALEMLEEGASSSEVPHNSMVAEGRDHATQRRDHATRGRDHATQRREHATRGRDHATPATQPADVVLGACEDGGYYLLGLRRFTQAVFAGISWGSAEVAEQTRVRAAQAGLCCRELPTGYDLDRFEDLRRAARESARPDMAPRLIPLRNLLEAIIQRIGEP